MQAPTAREMVPTRLRSPLTALWYREYVKPHMRFSVTAADGTLLRGVHFKSGHDTALIYCHGFLSSKNLTVVPRFVEMLAEEVDVLAFDFRGHGESEGATTVGEREVLDLAAVMNYAQGCRYRRIFVLGSSMGGAVALRYAAQSAEIAGVATIGAFGTAKFAWIGRQGLGLLQYSFARNIVRAVRSARVESAVPRTLPVAVVDRISPRPLLVIHGEFDPLVPVSDAHAFYARAREPKQLIVIPRGSHDLPHLNRRTQGWIVEWMERGRVSV